MKNQQAPVAVQVTIHAQPDRVWKALTDPEEIRQYMMGATVATDWKVGSSITWSGEWQGKAYEDKGTIKAFDEKKKMQYTHFSPMSGQEDRPENYHTVTLTLEEAGDLTTLHLTQEGAGSEHNIEESKKNWQSVLDHIKKLIEGKG